MFVRLLPGQLFASLRSHAELVRLFDLDSRVTPEQAASNGFEWVQVEARVKLEWRSSSEGWSGAMNLLYLFTNRKETTTRAELWAYDNSKRTKSFSSQSWASEFAIFEITILEKARNGFACCFLLRSSNSTWDSRWDFRIRSLPKQTRSLQVVKKFHLHCRPRRKNCLSELFVSICPSVSLYSRKANKIRRFFFSLRVFVYIIIITISLAISLAIALISDWLKPEKPDSSSFEWLRYVASESNLPLEIIWVSSGCVIQSEVSFN